MGALTCVFSTTKKRKLEKPTQVVRAVLTAWHENLGLGTERDLWSLYGHSSKFVSRQAYH